MNRQPLNPLHRLWILLCVLRFHCVFVVGYEKNHVMYTPKSETTLLMFTLVISRPLLRTSWPNIGHMHANAPTLVSNMHRVLSPRHTAL